MHQLGNKLYQSYKWFWMSVTLLSTEPRSPFPERNSTGAYRCHAELFPTHCRQHILAAGKVDLK